MNTFTDIEGNVLDIGDTVALSYSTFTVAGEITAFTKKKVRIKGISMHNRWSGWTFLKYPSQLLRIRL